jgi:hypothetical protein
MRRFEKGVAEKRRAGRRIHGGFDSAATQGVLYLSVTRNTYSNMKNSPCGPAPSQSRGVHLCSATAGAGLFAQSAQVAQERAGASTLASGETAFRSQGALALPERRSKASGIYRRRSCSHSSPITFMVRMRGACVSSLHSLTVSVMITRC